MNIVHIDFLCKELHIPQGYYIKQILTMSHDYPVHEAKHNSVKTVPPSDPLGGSQRSNISHNWVSCQYFDRIFACKQRKTRYETNQIWFLFEGQGSITCVDL